MWDQGNIRDLDEKNEMTFIIYIYILYIYIFFFWGGEMTGAFFFLW